MNITAGEGEPPAHRKLMRRPRGTAQNDFGGENVSRKAREPGDLYPHELAERVTDLQVMGCDMERYGFHSPRNYARRCPGLGLLID